MKRRVAYMGVSLEGDLRAWLVRLAAELESALEAAPRPATTADQTWDIPLPRNRVRDAADVIRRAARMKSLPELFPERLGHRPESGRPAWMVLDAIHSGDEPSVVAKRWDVQVGTLTKYIRELGSELNRYRPFDGEIDAMRKDLCRRRRRK